MSVLLYGSETMIWRKERSRSMSVQMDNLRGLLGNRRMDRGSNAQTRVLYGVMKRVNENIDESVLQLFTVFKEWRNERIAKRVYVRRCLIG